LGSHASRTMHMCVASPSALFRVPFRRLTSLQTPLDVPRLDGVLGPYWVGFTGLWHTSHVLSGSVWLTGSVAGVNALALLLGMLSGVPWAVALFWFWGADISVCEWFANWREICLQTGGKSDACTGYFQNILCVGKLYKLRSQTEANWSLV
jgi:hypothetical protein